MSTQLHQVLAAEKTSMETLKSILKETHHTFKGATRYFDGSEVKTTTNFEGADSKDEVTRTQPVTTVQARIEFTLAALEGPLDTVLTKDETNCSGNAKTALIVDNVNFGEFSAIALISLGKQLKELRTVFFDIPTLDQHEHTWTPDDNIIQGGFVSETSTKLRVKQHDVARKVLGFPDDPKSPTYTVKEDFHFGDVITRQFSTRWTPTQKHQVLAKLDKLIIAVEKAKSVANQCEIKNTKVAAKFFDFILGK